MPFIYKLAQLIGSDLPDYWALNYKIASQKLDSTKSLPDYWAQPKIHGWQHSTAGLQTWAKLSSREVYFISERGVKQLIGPALVLFSNLVSIKTCFEHQVKLE